MRSMKKIKIRILIKKLKNSRWKKYQLNRINLTKKIKLLSRI
jgi:hypothetical protein